ncbi:MAG: hypothetical protein ACQEVA_17985 [Myxococcota bacterium]
MAVAIEINDRRRRRSDDADTALRYQLEQVVQDFDLTSCILSDTEGRVVAEAHDFHDEPEDPAAVDPMTQDTIIDGSSTPIDVTDDIDCLEFRSEGTRFFITAQGQDDSMREVALYRVVLGAKRIYKECMN